MGGLLPTTSAGPLPSSSLIAEPTTNGAAPEPAAWAVTGLTLSAEQAIEILGACLGQNVLAPGIVVGPTLSYWASALRFAGGLVARQQFLPGLRSRDGQLEARWEPVVTGPDAHRLAELAQAMPGACRALAAISQAAPAESAASVLASFVAEVVDQLVRSSSTARLHGARAPRREGKRKDFDSLHDQWIHALTAADARLSGSAAELAQFAEKVAAWKRPIAVSAAAPFRLCLRLEEPAVKERNGKPVASKGGWMLRYLLQASDDPSLLVPVAEAWKARGRTAKIFEKAGARPREYVLGALGQATALWTPIETSLKTAEPSGCTLDVSGAFEFLTQKASLFEQAGFGVLLPAWWTRKGTKLRLAAQAKVKSSPMTSKRGLSLEEVLAFEWEIALGDQLLSLSELQALAKLKVPLVRVRGQWVQLSAEEIQAALEFWEKRALSTVTARDAVQMALGKVNVPGGLAFAGVKAEGWIADLLEQLKGAAALESLAAPEEFQGTLRPYQVRGYSWLGFLRRWGLGACLADDMGLGKTVQTLALIEREWECNGRRPSLLVCPMSVVGNWQKEAARFTPNLPVLVHHGTSRVKGKAFSKQVCGKALVLSSYPLLHRDLETFTAVRWGGVILDEAQNIKNPQTKQAQAARAIPADYRIALTGTPVENHVGDLWSIMEFLNPGLLGTQAWFKRTFHVPIQVSRDPEASQALQQLTGPFILRRLKTDKSIIADLPEKLEMKVFCNLTKEQASLYEAVVQDATAKIAKEDGIKRKGLVLATLTKLKQVCNHPAQFLGDNSPVPGRSGKLNRLSEMLEEALEAGDRALVFSQYAEMGGMLRTYLQETFGSEVLFLHGAVSKAQRDRMVDRFQTSDHGPRIFVLSLKAGGTGLNLTAANHVFHFDRWWNPAVENQATDRAFRIGQKRRVQVHKFLCIGTMEEKIDEMLESKKLVAGAVVGTGEDWLTKLSTEELRDVFALRQEALGE